TTKFTGRGLGLASVLGILRGHKGGIEVSSALDKGTAFRVFLPASEAIEHGGEELLVRADDEEWQGSGTVLLVDDESTVRKTGRRVLQRLGFDVLTATDGVDALKVFQLRRDDIVLIILDLTMPRMDGRQTFEALRTNGADVPIVVSSGYSEEDVISRFENDAPAGFVQKPYRLSDLRRCLYSALGNTSE
ncbi:MAG: response regulator, partial [Lentisphaerae bacterium]|nr:response regulator [Lentisphaerota bacterium]